MVVDMVYWALMVVVSRFEFRIQTCLNNKVILLTINILKLFHTENFLIFQMFLVLWNKDVRVNVSLENNDVLYLSTSFHLVQKNFFEGIFFPPSLLS